MPSSGVAASAIGGARPLLGIAMAIGGAIGFIVGRGRKIERCSRCVSKLTLGAVQCGHCGSAITEDLPSRKDLRALAAAEPPEPRKS